MSVAHEFLRALVDDGWERPARGVVIAATNAGRDRVHAEMEGLVLPFIERNTSGQLELKGGSCVRFFNGSGMRPDRLRGHTVDLLLWFCPPGWEWPRGLEGQMEIIMATRSTPGYGGPRVWHDG